MVDFSTLGVAPPPLDFNQRLAPQREPNNLEAAQRALDMTPEERGLYQMHLKNLYGPGGVDHPSIDPQNPLGSRSSLYQTVENHGGRFYNVPTVWNGKIEAEPYKTTRGDVVDIANPTAIANITKHGWDRFPSYATPEEADARYQAMHEFMDRDTGAFLKARGMK